LTPRLPVRQLTYQQADPPFLVLHGEADQLVPIEQSEILPAKLQAAGVPAELVRVANAGHGFIPENGKASALRAKRSRKWWSSFLKSS